MVQCESERRGACKRSTKDGGAAARGHSLPPEILDLAGRQRRADVEDEAPVRALGVGLFADAGFRPIDAADGDEALEILGANAEVQLLFTDVNLPGSIDGLALARQVRDRRAHIGIVVVSGRSVPRLHEFPAGCRFHRKPYDWDSCGQPCARIDGRNTSVVFDEACGVFAKVA
jgi:two-component system, response regulator PdtaR